MSIVNATHRTKDVQFNLTYMDKGVVITEIDLSNQPSTVEDEWWYTWEELFTELTGFTTDDDSLNIVHGHAWNVE
jgi:hypothetical protein